MYIKSTCMFNTLPMITQRFETRPMDERANVDEYFTMLRLFLFIFLRERNHWKICFSSFSILRGKIDFLASSFSVPPTHSRCTRYRNLFCLQCWRFSFLSEKRRGKRTPAIRKMFIWGREKKCLNLFVKALIDKTSDKFITCKIQFDATLLWLASTTAIEAYYLSIQFGILVVKSIEKWVLAFYTLNKSLTILTSIILIDDGAFVYFVILCFKSFLKRLEIFAITLILRFNWNMKIIELIDESLRTLRRYFQIFF